MDPEMTYWLASTVAQAIVALLAFGAFLAISRRDALWDSVKDDLQGLADSCRSIGDTPYGEDSTTVYSLVEKAGKRPIYDEAPGFYAAYEKAREPDDRLDIVATAVEPWLAFEWPSSELLSDTFNGYLCKMKRLGAPVVSARNVRQQILRRLQVLTLSSVAAFVWSLLLISRAQVMQRVDWLNVGLVVSLEVVTGIAAASAALLTLACLGHRAKPGPE